MKSTKSIRLDRKLHKAARIHCIKNDMTLGDLITKVLEKKLHGTKVLAWLRRRV